MRYFGHIEDGHGVRTERVRPGRPAPPTLEQILQAQDQRIAQMTPAQQAALAAAYNTSLAASAPHSDAKLFVVSPLAWAIKKTWKS